MAETWGKEVAKWTKITDGDEDKTASIMTDSQGNDRLRGETRLVGDDTLAVEREAQVVTRNDGVKALAVDSRTVVESTFGSNSVPDAYFVIRDTGGAGTTWTVFINGTANDPSSPPDRDVPSYTKVFTVQVSEENDEIAFRDRIITTLNQDVAFKTNSELKAQRATDRAIVHIFSTSFTLSGEFYERLVPGDFAVTIGGAPGDGVVVVPFDILHTRNLPVATIPDFDSPHRLSRFGVTGDINISFKDLDDIFIQYATDDGTPSPDGGGTGSEDLLVNGSLATPVLFSISAQNETDIFCQTLIFRCQGNGIKLPNFFAKNIGLTNGVVVEIKSDDVITTFLPLRTTSDFKNRWAALSGTMASWELSVEAGRDEAVAILNFTNPFVIKAQGTHGAGNDDYIEVKIQDDLSSGNFFFDFLVRGFEAEP